MPVVELRLDGGNTGGAVRVGDTVRRTPGPWTPAVHALLSHLHAVGFNGCPKPLGLDEQGREVLTFLPGETVGSTTPWPGWVHDERTLVQAANWLREYHQAVEGFVPPVDARWRLPGQGTLICHNDAAPYNAAWHSARLTGFFDWDFAGPGTPEWDLAFTAFAWVPLHAEHVVRAEGFVELGSRRRRLETFLDAYGWTGEIEKLAEVLAQRLTAHINGITELADGGDPLFRRLIDEGTCDAVAEARDALPRVLELTRRRAARY